MDDCIDKLREAQAISALEALGEYWQVSIIEEDKDDKTIFSTHLGAYRNTQLPFGLRNGHNSFQHALDIILSGVS